MINFVLDCETELIAPGRCAPRVACVSVVEGDGAPELLTAAEAVERLHLWANNPLAGWLVGHNIAFDLACLCRSAPGLAACAWSLYDAGQVWDTGINERLRALALGWEKHPGVGRPIVSGGVSLASLALALVGVDIGASKSSADSVRYQYGRLVGVPFAEWSDEARRYALDDARVTALVQAKQYDDLRHAVKNVGVEIDERATVRSGGAVVLRSYASFSLQCAADFALFHLRAWGLRTSPDSVEAWRLALEQRKRELITRPRAAGLVRDDGTKNAKAIAAAVELCYGVAACPRTEKGAPSTAGEVLISSGDATLKDLGALAEIDKLLGTFGPVLEGAARGVLNPRWNVLVRSGRTSCIEPNLQQLPREGGVRECFRPRAGSVYIGADYSTAELVALAQVCLDMGLSSKMAEAINSGRDLHLALAADLAKCSYDEAVARRKAGDAEIKRLRGLAKVPNFGLPGGLGVDGLVGFAQNSYGVTLSQSEAEALRAAWFSAWPEMKGYFSEVMRAVDRGYVIQHRTRRRRGAVGFTDGANTYFQGLVADGAKTALIEVVKGCWLDSSSPLYGARPVAFVHDEIICECPEERAPEAAEELARVMVAAMRPFTPAVSMSADPWASRVWRKGLEGERDANGRLVILD